MYKLSALALGSASALNIDLFNLRNYINMPAQGLVKGLLASANQDLFEEVQAPGVVAYKQCSDDVGQFTFDDGSTYNKPDPAKKGSDVTLHLAGVFGT